MQSSKALLAAMALIPSISTSPLPQMQARQFSPYQNGLESSIGLDIYSSSDCTGDGESMTGALVYGATSNYTYEVGGGDPSQEILIGSLLSAGPCNMTAGQVLEFSGLQTQSFEMVPAATYQTLNNTYPFVTLTCVTPPCFIFNSTDEAVHCTTNPS